MARGMESRKSVEASQEPTLHVRHAWPQRALAIDPVRAGGRGARLEDGVHVADEQETGSAARQAADDEVPKHAGHRATSPPPLRSTDAPSRPRCSTTASATRFTPSGVYEPQSMLTSCSRSARYAGRPVATRSPKVRHEGGGGHGAETILAAMPADRPPEPAVELLELRVLEGPNRFANRPAIKIEFQGDPEAVVRVARDAGELVRHLHHELGFPAPRVTFRRSDDGTRAMAAFAWRRRTIAQAIAGAAARVALGSGSERRELRGLRAVAHGPRSVLPLPRVPIVAITGTNGKSTTTRLIAHVAADGRIAGGDDQLRRDLRPRRARRGR